MGCAKVLVALLLVGGICPRTLKEDRHKDSFNQVSREASRNGRQQGATNFRAFKEGRKEGRKGGGKVEKKQEEVRRGKVGSPSVEVGTALADAFDYDQNACRI